jgi:hypothetical protein
MKAVLPVLAVLFLLPPAPAVELELLLDATRAVEQWDGRDGAAGELGPYQIRAATWRQHMGDLPFPKAREERWGRECARRHLAWLQEQLAAAGVDPSAFNLALAYNAGLQAVLRGRAPVRAYQHATRVRNLSRHE